MTALAANAITPLKILQTSRVLIQPWIGASLFTDRCISFSDNPNAVLR